LGIYRLQNDSVNLLGDEVFDKLDLLLHIIVAADMCHCRPEVLARLVRAGLRIHKEWVVQRRIDEANLVGGCGSGDSTGVRAKGQREECQKRQYDGEPAAHGHPSPTGDALIATAETERSPSVPHSSPGGRI